MDDRIALLPEKIANQIAAGEVVNQPACVVKEMMENAIDAGATEVIVNYRHGGHELIQIIDNGCGMTPNDARLAFDRHATSKIRSAEDIYALSTFGFRGEALASIAAVAEVELRTKAEDAEMGTTTRVNGGVFVEQSPISCDKGSQFIVRNLFYNLPARRKFLKSENTSSNLIKSEFRRVALCNPDIAFELYSDDSQLFKLAVAPLAGRIVDLMGRAYKRNILELSTQTPIVNISGYIGLPAASKRSTSDQYLFVNGRYFKSPQLSKAVAKGYEKLIPQGTFPSFFLYLEVEPDKIDVNVHPQKTEVKFVDETSIWQIINASVRETLARTGAVPMMEFDAEDALDMPVFSASERNYREPRVSSNSEYNPFKVSYNNHIASLWESEFDEVESSINNNYIEPVEAIDQLEDYESQYQPIAQPQEPEREHFTGAAFEIEQEDENVKIVNMDSATDATIHCTFGYYAWCGVGRDMVAVDLRRAKERILYDHYIKSIQSGDSASQKILFPIEMELSHDEYTLIKKSLGEFTRVGFEIEVGEKEHISISGLPADVGMESAESLIHELIEILSMTDTLEEQRRDNMAQRMARNGAQRVGRTTTIKQAEEVIKQLLHNGNTGFTPSGKRIMWPITPEHIRKQLG